MAIKDRIAKTGKRPKAIILVHLYGMPAKVNEILAIAKTFEIPVIEDAAEAIGSKYHDKYLGGFGDLGIYSFNGNKIITTSGGGALVSDNETWIQKARFLSTQAREHAPHYQHVEIGYNYRLSNVCAGIGRGQLQVLNDRVAQRRANFEYYKEALRDTPGISLLEEPPEFVLQSMAYNDPDRSQGNWRCQQRGYPHRITGPKHRNPTVVEADAFAASF